MFDEQWQFAVEVEREYAQYRKKVMMRYHLSAAEVDILLFLANNCIFRKNCASVPEERSAIPLQTEQSSAG